jgi:hypothetical protein
MLWFEITNKCFFSKTSRCEVGGGNPIPEHRTCSEVTMCTKRFTSRIKKNCKEDSATEFRIYVRLTVGVYATIRKEKKKDVSFQRKQNNQNPNPKKKI